MEEHGARAFHARQLMRWMYGRGVRDFSAMSDLSKPLRTVLEANTHIEPPTVLARHASADGTRKWLIAAGGGQRVETVFIPETERGTLCISSQVGCVLDCSFCATGAQGFNRNLDAAEIVGQVWLATRELENELGADKRHVTNVVFMGMGEPLANFRNVVAAADILMDDLGFGLSRRRVTISTAGLVPQIRKLGEISNVALAVSLHAPNDRLRNELVPINRKHPIAELLEACWEYAGPQTGRYVTFEYVMLDGINDSAKHARQLADLLVGKPAKVNLIPFNPFPGTEYRRSPSARISAFQDILSQRNVRTTTRKTRGDDISAACGQLAGRVSDRIKTRLSSRTFQSAEQISEARRQ